MIFADGCRSPKLYITQILLVSKLKNYYIGECLIKIMNMNEQTKSLIRHLLTAIGFLLASLGLADASDMINGILANLDGIWDAVLVLSGTVIGIIGFFKNKDRFEKG